MGGGYFTRGAGTHKEDGNFLCMQDPSRHDIDGGWFGSDDAKHAGPIKKTPSCLKIEKVFHSIIPCFPN